MANSAGENDPGAVTVKVAKWSRLGKWGPWNSSLLGWEGPISGVEVEISSEAVLQYQSDWENLNWKGSPMEMKEPLEGQEGLLVGLEGPFRQSERASTTIASRSCSEASEAITVTKAFASGKTLTIAAFDSAMMETICKAEGVAQETAVKL